MKLILPTSSKVFILTTELPDADALPAQTLEADTELMTLYGAAFNIELLHVEHAFEPHPEGVHLPPQALAHKVYRLSLKG